MSFRQAGCGGWEGGRGKRREEKQAKGFFSLSKAISDRFWARIQRACTVTTGGQIEIVFVVKHQTILSPENRKINRLLQI